MWWGGHHTNISAAYTGAGQSLCQAVCIGRWNAILMSKTFKAAHGQTRTRNSQAHARTFFLAASRACTNTSRCSKASQRNEYEQAPAQSQTGVCYVLSPTANSLKQHVLRCSAERCRSR